MSTLGVHAHQPQTFRNICLAWIYDSYGISLCCLPRGHSDTHLNMPRIPRRDINHQNPKWTP